MVFIRTWITAKGKFGASGTGSAISKGYRKLKRKPEIQKDSKDSDQWKKS
jgi:hypothetical protein